MGQPRQVILLLILVTTLSACRVSPETTGPLPSQTTNSTQPFSATEQLAQTPGVTPSPSPGINPSPSLSRLTPTSLPRGSPTQVEPTPSETTSPTPQPADLPTSTASPELPAISPTFTKVPGIASTIPKAEIQIDSPGPLSKVISPIKLHAYLPLGHVGSAIVELWGEKTDRPPLVRLTLAINSQPDGRIALATDLNFEIPAVSEIGRLVISAFDQQGRIAALASVDLILLSVGNAELNPPGDLLESIVILNPQEKGVARSGILKVSGLARLGDSQPLRVEILTLDGKRLGPTRLIEVTPSNEYKHVPFSIDLPYTVETDTFVRVVISEPASGRIPGTVHISSRQVWLLP